MASRTRFVDLIQHSIDQFLAERHTEFDSIAPELTPVLNLAKDYLAGGKRFRALFCYWGWQAVSAEFAQSDPLREVDLSPDLEGVLLAASALEVFHAAALVHDDIMDKSDTRRGAPSAHKRFETIHHAGGWRGDGASFGHSSALLLGDLLLGWSDELFDQGTAILSSSACGLAARAEFSKMRTEVTAGQYLDILEENAWATYPESTALSRAHRVVVFKSAKYSIEAPLAIGAALGGATLAQTAALRAFGLPLGIAFQLRDDLLGVFGDPEVTGKPAGDDLREGKRTVLIALTREKLPGPTRKIIDELLGDPTLNDEQIATVRRTIVESGAVAEVETVIDHNVAIARTAIQDAPIATDARTQLLLLADTVTRRDA